MPRVQPAAALVLALTALIVLPSSALAGSTDPDASFGSGGVTTTAFGTTSAFAFDLAAAPDGKLVAVGGVEDGSHYDWIVARYSADGVLDETFATGGRLVDDEAYPYFGATVVAVDAAGSIYYTGPVEGTDAQIVATKVDSSGAPSFTGSISVTGATTTVGRAIALAPDGKVLVAGDALTSSTTRGFVARFLVNGEPDPAFGTGGVLFLDAECPSCGATSLALSGGGDIYAGTDSGRVVRLEDPGTGYEVDAAYTAAATTGLSMITDVVLQNGLVVAAGRAGSECAVARLGGEGNPDVLGFGTNGVGRVAVGGFCTINDVEVDAQGRLTFAGESSGTTVPGVLGRFDAAGQADNAFVSGGAVALSPGGTFSPFRGLVLQGAKPVVAGQADSPHKVLLARYAGDAGAGGDNPSPSPSPSPSPAPAADTIAPTIAWTSPVDHGAVNTATPTLSGTASNDPGDATTIPIDFRVLSGGQYVTVPGYGPQLTATRSATTWSVALPTRLADGHYFARAHLSDAAGNGANGGAGAPIVFRVDTAKPKIAIDYPANNGRTTDPRPLVSGSAGNREGDLVAVTLELRRKLNGGRLGSPKRIRGTRAGSFWSAQLPRIGDGDWTLRARLADDAGNSGLSATIAFKTGKLPAPSNSGSFKVDGDVEVGQVLGVRQSADFKPADDLRVRYRWERCADSSQPRGCDSVTALSDSPYYRVQSADRNRRLRVGVYASNPDREAPPHYSSVSRAVPPADQIPYIANQGYPRVVTTDIAVNDVVAAHEGDWRGYPSSFDYSYRWQVCRPGGCADVGSSKTYRVRSVDQGHRLNVIVTARNRAGSNYAWSGTGAPIAGDRAANRRALVADSYNKVFGRAPRADELAYWVGRSEDLAALIRNHQQYIRDNRSIAEQVVWRAYEKVYGHPPYGRDTEYAANQTAQFNADVDAEWRSGTTYDDLVTQYARALANQAIERIFFWARGVRNTELVERHIMSRDVSRFVEKVRRDAYASGGSTRGENLWTDVALSNEPLHGAARTGYKGAGSEGAADRENCYGAVGPGCTGVAGGQSTSTVSDAFTTLDGRKMSYVKVTTAVGSITHDAMCRVYPWTSFLKFNNGGWCGDAALDPTEGLPLVKLWVTGAAEWNKATGNTLQGRKWFEYYGPYPAPDSTFATTSKHARTYSDDLRTAPSQYRYTELTRGGLILGIADLDKPFKWQGTEIRGSLRLEAPAGTALDSSDRDFCHSGAFRYPKHLQVSGQRSWNVCT
jgi:uncharacterized delta-60 repeat protein